MLLWGGGGGVPILPEDKTLFLAIYDAASGDERKNPDSVIQAYKKAFPEERSDVGIIFKIGHGKEEAIAKIKDSLKEYKNVYYITDNLSLGQVYSLIERADVFISLPRAEGFGLMMAEAMSLGTPVITTGYSAHTEFMTEDSACMVKWKYVQLPKRFEPYPDAKYGVVKWAEPDIDDAARYIKLLSEDKALREKMSKRARAVIQEKLDPGKIAKRIRGRIREIYNESLPS